MVRKIIKIDKNLCNGCSLCADACHEGAIVMQDGKATLVREDYCDGLGDCLPVCPTGAITFEEREAPAYDHAAVMAAKAHKHTHHAHSEGGCPGSRPQSLNRAVSAKTDSAQVHSPVETASFLQQWPVQIQLVPTNTPYFQGAHLLVAADCTAFARLNFHRDYMQGKVTLIGCPKLDDADYAEKLTEILRSNDIQSVTVARMEVPCCGGMVDAVKKAILASEKIVPFQIVTVSIEGKIL